MVFSSHIFLFYFLPLVLAAYYALPGRARTALIAVSSYVFYGWANPSWAVIMFFGSSVDYVCGNGVLEGAELCDGEDLAGRACQSRGFEGGTLACNDSCDGFDLTGCVGCGDGRRRYPEECDGHDLAEQTCQDFGFDAGALACDESCGFDTAGCITLCGNGIRCVAKYVYEHDLARANPMRIETDAGIKTVAVYSEADEHSLHVRFADEDVRIGPARSADSYLNVPAVISAAEITGADAIHPGYGFLSESAYLAEVC